MNDVLTLGSSGNTLTIKNASELVYQIDGLEIVQQATSNDDLQHVVKFNSIEITNVTNSSPCVITTDGDHNFSTGDIIFIQSTTINDLDKKNFEVTVLSSNTFSVPVNTNTTSSSGNVSKEKFINSYLY